MSKFNQSNKGINTTTNLAGGTAYNIVDQRNKLAIQVLTSMMNEKRYYGDKTNEVIKLTRTMLDIDAKFVANLAIYTRKEMHMRSVTHMLIAELAHHINGKPYVKQTIMEAVERVDDMTEILSYYINTFGKPIPNSLKKGLAKKFLEFNEYSLQKYNRDGQVKLKDVIMLSHPKPQNAEQSILLKKVLDDNLATPTTWETTLSANDGRTKTEKWHELIDNRSLGYMATLRNLRNIIDNCDSDHIDKVLDYITNENAVKNNKLLPFRYFSAYRELQDHPMCSSKILDAIEKAMSISTANLPKLEGITFFSTDTSGSMDDPISDRSKVSMKDIGLLLMSIGHQVCDNSITSVFAREFKAVNTSTRNGIIANMNEFSRHNVGLATYAHKVFEYLLANNIYVDRIVIFSDMQTYKDRYTLGGSVQSLLNEYKWRINPNVYLHSVDLSNYGTSMVMQDKNVNLVGGFSERMIEFIYSVEQGIDTLTSKIDDYFFKEVVDNN